MYIVSSRIELHSKTLSGGGKGPIDRENTEVRPEMLQAGLPFSASLEQAFMEGAEEPTGRHGWKCSRERRPCASFGPLVCCRGDAGGHGRQPAFELCHGLFASYL